MATISLIDGYVKLLPPTSRAIESVCAWLARDLGLPIPQPLFVDVSRSRLPQNYDWPYPNATRVTAFGSVAVAALPLVPEHVDLLRSWPSLLDVAIYDHLIANEDRSNSNILLSSKNSFYIIDHERSLGGGGNPLFSKNHFPLIKNMLLDVLSVRSTADKNAMRNEIILFCARCLDAVERIPYEALLVEAEVVEQIQGFLRARAAMLKSLVFQYLNIEELPGFNSVSIDARPH